MPPRRALHQPIFPIYTSSPSPQPSPAPSFPKHPSSFSSHSTPTTTTTTNNLPFFPLYPSPPPPPPSPSLPTFPANISTLSSTTSSHSIPPSKLIIFISLPILCLLFLFLSAALFLLILRRNIRSSTNDFDTEPASDNHRLVPPNSTASDKPPATPSQHNSSEFLYLGTLVNSRGHVASSHASGEVGPTIAAGSPELRPLPPLSRQSRRSFESDEEFYSPPPYSKAPPPPPPPPPPAMMAGRLKPPVLPPPKLHQDSSLRQDSERRPRLKALHWDKVRASSDRTMVWDHLRSSSFQLNEEMMETLFGCDVNGGKGREVGDVKRKVGLGTTAVAAAARSEEMVLNLKKAQNIAILLRALNVTTEEVCEAILEGSTDSLGNELLETLLRMAPSKEEEIKLREYKDNSSYKLGPAEKFLKAMLDIPFAFKRVDAMLYITNFDAEIKYLTKSFETLEVACEELRNSRLFRKLLDAVLKTGNRMNVGTNRGDAQAFKLDTLLKLVDIKGTDGKTTLLHFVVQEISRTEGFRQTTTNPQSNSLQDNLECKRLGLSVVSRLGAELSNVKKAATMDSDVLSGYVSKLAGGITRVRELVRLNETTDSFHESMTRFLKMAEDEISKLQNQEGVALSLVKEITEYFHGDSAKEEAHPLRIFMVVKDFLMTLDQVCKDVGRVNERSVVSSMRQFPVPASVGNPPVFPQIHGVQPGSSDDESSSLSSFSS